MEETKAKPRRRRLRLAVVLTLCAAGLGAGGYFVNRYVIQSNFAVVVPGKVYRSGQPSPAQVDKWVCEYRIKTIINLRGNKLDICKAEEKQAGGLKVKFFPIALGARNLVSKARVTALIEALDKAPQPVLLHCQGGNDRSGFASMLAMLAFGHTDYKTARKQLYIPAVRWDKSKKHITDTIVMYEQYCAAKKLDPNSWPLFKKWAITVYNPDAKEVESKNQAE